MLYRHLLCMKTVSSWLVVLFLGACTTTPKAPLTELQQCKNQLYRLQKTITDFAIRDAQYSPVNDFPTYRSNRFWSSFSLAELTQEQQHFLRQQWHQLGMDSLQIEWKNLPTKGKSVLRSQVGLNHFDEFRQRCDQLLFQASLSKPIQPDQLDVDDNYSTLQRVFGVYALTQYVAASYIDEYQADMRSKFENFIWDTDQTAILFQHSATPKPTSVDVNDWLKEARERNPLKIPVLELDQLDELAQYHAPTLRILQQSEADLIGSAQWQQGERAIEYTQSVVYFNPSYIRYQGETLLQLNYTAWFSERPKTSEYDWYGGKLDGLMWRVTLQSNGDVLFYDSIHPCGCYHSVHVPQSSPLLAHLQKSDQQQIPEPILYFVSILPAQAPQPLLTLEAGTHYLINISDLLLTDPVPAESRPYVLNEYDRLRALPTEDGFKNWFDHDGIITSSQRFERYFLWPLGVPSAGAMRQQGRHAIAFVGKRHFDEPSVEKLLELQH